MLDKHDFNKWAGNYDESIKSSDKSFPFTGYYDVLSTIVSLVHPKRDLKVLDVGIGTGLLSEELYKQGCIIHGVDFSDKMIEITKLKIPNGDFDTCNVIANHFGKFSSNKYNAIVSSYFIHHLNLTQKTQFIKRTLSNNLMPNSKLIIADIGFESEQEFDDAHTNYQSVWDEDEYYLCGDTIVSHLKSVQIQSKYKQISNCAGILICNN